MLDLETIGSNPNSVVLSVGAVSFNSEIITDQKEWFLDVDSQITQGRRVDFDTLKWWIHQSDEAQDIFNDRFLTSLSFFAGEFQNFWTRTCGDGAKIWGNGADFDIPILTTLLVKNGVKAPWKFWNSRCFRTVKAMYGIDKLIEFEGVRHGALTDALHQAKCLQLFFKNHPELER
jgi:hypothetical protein